MNEIDMDVRLLGMQFKLLKQISRDDKLKDNYIIKVVKFLKKYISKSA